MIPAARRQPDLPRFRYRSYGLAIESEIELSGLLDDDRLGLPSPRLTIVRSAIDDAAIVSREPMVFVNRGDEQLLAWEMVGAFRIPSDDRIEVDANDGVPDSLVALPLLGAVLATLLHRRGLAVFHASAVSVKGAAVVLLGDKGAGKSTTAGALIGGGHRLIADDVVALDCAGGGASLVLPAFGQLKLWDDSGRQLRAAGVTPIGRLHDKIEKSHYELAAGFATAPTPLARLYVLDRSDTPGVRRLRAGDALAHLLRHSYMARFGDAGFGGELAPHFQRVAGLVKAGRVRILAVPATLDRINLIPGLVEADLAEIDTDILA